jgi:hypothetical protein
MPITLKAAYSWDVMLAITGRPVSVSISSITSTTGKFVHGMKIASAFRASFVAFLAA